MCSQIFNQILPNLCQVPEANTNSEITYRAVFDLVKAEILFKNSNCIHGPQFLLNENMEWKFCEGKK